MQAALQHTKATETEVIMWVGTRVWKYASIYIALFRIQGTYRCKHMVAAVKEDRKHIYFEHGRAVSLERSLAPLRRWCGCTRRYDGSVGGRGGKRFCCTTAAQSERWTCVCACVFDHARKHVWLWVVLLNSLVPTSAREWEWACEWVECVCVCMGICVWICSPSFFLLFLSVKPEQLKDRNRKKGQKELSHRKSRL